jgi:aminobenzoyl-glutamate transport protein
MTTGITYGRAIGKIEKWTQIPKLMAKSLDSVLGFIVISLPASVFIHLFNASNMPIVLGVNGANFINSMHLNGFAILFFIALVTTFMNLFMTSGSAKWMIFAPILIPMFYAVGFTPALTALAYRIGDSATNAIAPISTDIALIIGLLEKYRSDQNAKVGMGTVISLCLPYAIMAFVLMILLLAVWYYLNLPLGPGVNMFMPGFRQ